MSNNEPMDVVGLWALAQLICTLNPYTEVKDDSASTHSHQMVVGRPDHAAGDERKPDQTRGYSVEPVDAAGPKQRLLAIMESEDVMRMIENRLRSVNLEVEENYGTSWDFKGQKQSVKTAFRVPYTFKVKRNGRSYWQTEHVLIGFAGADGGG